MQLVGSTGSKQQDDKLLELQKIAFNYGKKCQTFIALNCLKSTCEGQSSSNLTSHIFWRHPDRHELTEKEWAQQHAQAFMLDIAFEGARWLFLFNASTYDIQFHLPSDTDNKVWLQHIDTSINNGLNFIPDDTKEQFAVRRARSFKLLEFVEKKHEN